MTIHTIYIETPDDMTGQDVVSTIDGAFAYAHEDYTECIAAGVDKEEEAAYKRKIDCIESLHILEDEPPEVARPYSPSINCPACYSASRKRLEDPHWDYECKACSARYTGLTHSDQKRIAKGREAKDITRNNKSIIPDPTTRARDQASNEKHYADILDKHLTPEQKLYLKENPDGHMAGYGVTGNALESHKKHQKQQYAARKTKGERNE